MTTIFEGTYYESIAIKNLLTANNIEVFSINELMSNLEPWAISPGGLSPLKLNIQDSDFEKAKVLIDDYLNVNNHE